MKHGLVLTAVVSIIISFSAILWILVLLRPSTSPSVPRDGGIDHAATAWSQDSGDDSLDWKTYHNAVYGFTVRYPAHYSVSINGPYGKRYPKFTDRSYLDGYEPPGLTLDFDPIHDLDRRNFTVNATTFELANRHDNALHIYFSNNVGRNIYATCTIYDSTPGVLNVCNAILASITFTD